MVEVDASGQIAWPLRIRVRLVLNNGRCQLALTVELDRQTAISYRFAPFRFEVTSSDILVSQ